jgi:4-amino-4-deoxy-L-arabinose transferase-like glycosyltransferase
MRAAFRSIICLDFSGSRKNFFFEKKKQKTFALAPSRQRTGVNSVPAVTDKSFLVLFFKKEHLPFFLLTATALRLLVAGVMPLSADEAYYRVWAHAPAAGYLDHPPMVALWIGAGTSLLGDTRLGIRLLDPLAVWLGSWFLLRAGNDLAPGQGTGARAVWLLNATLLLNAGAITATPDTPLLLFWTGSLAALARLIRSGNGLWWLAAGLAGGLAFDAKYTAALLAPSLLVWLIAVPAMRPWLRRWQPYAATGLALLLAAPVFWWNEVHHWASFVRQGGRTQDWHPAAALGHVAELLGGQIGLATPLLFLVFGAGIMFVTRGGRWRAPAAGLLAATILLPACVFLQHAIGDRVQANWPAVIYPSLALAAAMTPMKRWARATAIGTGLMLSGLVMLQAAAAPFALPRKLDVSLIRLAGWADLARAAESARVAAGADCIAADEYGLAAELAYHLSVPVLGAEPRWSHFNLPPAPASCRTVLLVRSARRTDRLARAAWPDATPAGTATRARGVIVAERYTLYRAATPAGAVLLPPRHAAD